jgi:ATP-dependent DNA helicase RecG
MALPINIDELLNGRTVEWERIEFREGWNPERTLKTICAFANDFNNWGGGYIIIGVAENNGQPILPQTGLQLNQIDSIQQELNNLCRKILPNYFPIVEPIDFQNKKILILWCPGGSNRPYKAPETLGNNPQYFYYIRRYSSTVQPTRDEERELLGMANQIPFDDQVNHHAGISDLDLSTIKIFLNEIGSDLEKEIPNLSINEIARRMNIAEGPDEYLLPKNVGLLFFGKYPQKHFPSAKIEIIVFKDESGTEYSEKVFTGNLHEQLKDSLQYLQNNFTEQSIKKSAGIAESQRISKYPYAAIEESLCNAVYHRGYDNDSPIEVRIYPNWIDIISYPGPLPPLDKERLKNNQFDVRKYRNRRIGEFLKDLHLTEGRATGIPTIVNAMKKNGSPAPLFETDDNRTYFKTTLFIHPDFAEIPEKEQVRVHVREQVNLFTINNLGEILTAYSRWGEQVRILVRGQVNEAVKQVNIRNMTEVLSFCIEPKKRKDILSLFGLTNIYKNYNSHIVLLINDGLLERTLPDKHTSPNQKYKTTEKGIKLLEILE